MDTFLIQSVIFCLDSVIVSIFQTYDEAKVKASRKVQLPWQDGQLDMDTPNAAYSPKYDLSSSYKWSIVFTLSLSGSLSLFFVNVM